MNAIHQDSNSSSSSDSTHTSEMFTSHHNNDSVVGNSVLFMDQTVAESTGAYIARTAYSSTMRDREDTTPVETTQTGSLMDRPDSTYADQVDDSVMQISGTGGMDRRPFGIIPGRLGIVGDSNVKLSISDTGLHWGTGWSVAKYFENITWSKRDWHWRVRMLSLRGVLYGTSNRIFDARLRHGHGHRCHYGN